MRIYLAHAIEAGTASDNILAEEAYSSLKANGHDIFDPVEENEQAMGALAADKLAVKTSNQHSGYVRLIVENDLQAVAKSDMLFVIYSKGVRKGAGVHGEMTLAAYLMKPIVVWHPNYDMKKAPDWVFGCCHPKFMNKDLAESLKAVDFIESMRSLQETIQKTS